MKKIYTLLTAALAIAGTATAQQLPGGTFNGDWETCYPNAGTNAVGEQPANWGASNVYQMMSFELVTQTADRTSTDANAHSAHLNNTFCGIPGLMGAAAAEATQYTGYLNIEMMGNQLATNQEATVEITDNGNGTCTFSLPNFSLGGSASMGDIVVENVTMTEADGTTTYTGSVKGLSLAEGQIIADVELNGTIDANGTVDFVINVTWNGIPINVTFTSNPVSDTTEYTGYLNIEMMGSQLATNQEATVEITDNGNGTCTFSLPNFSLGGSASMGDIVVENVTMTEADGTTTYTGSVKGLSLAEGQIIADVELNGTIDANGTVDFVINVTWNGIPINVTFTSNPVSDTTEYTGYLNIEMMGNQLATNQEATVEITDNGNGTCTFSLPNFSLGGSASMGDIVVENVTMTEADGTTTYTGSVKGLSLAEGQIIADVELNGTIDANGTVDFVINVTWNGIPIYVTFTSDPTSSVANIDANGTAIYGTTGAIAINGYTGTASIYGITGQLLKSVPVDGNALINIDGGIYIVHIDGTTAKVLVK